MKHFYKCRETLREFLEWLHFIFVELIAQDRDKSVYTQTSVIFIP